MTMSTCDGANVSALTTISATHVVCESGGASASSSSLRRGSCTNEVTPNENESPGRDKLGVTPAYMDPSSSCAVTSASGATASSKAPASVSDGTAIQGVST